MNETPLYKKIVKLLALADNEGATEAESLSALAKATKLAAEAGLELALVRAAEMKENTPLEFREDMTRVLGKRKTSLDHAVADVLSRALEVKVFWRSGGQNQKLFVFASPEKSAIAKITANFLYEEMPRLAKDLGYTGPDRAGYYMGLADGYIQQARDGRKAGVTAAKEKISREKEGEPDAADKAEQIYTLALIQEEKLLQEAFRKAFPRMGSACRSRAELSPTAYDRGRKDGRRLSIKPRLRN